MKKVSYYTKSVASLAGDGYATLTFDFDNPVNADKTIVDTISVALDSIQGISNALGLAQQLSITSNSVDIRLRNPSASTRTVYVTIRVAEYN